MFVLFSIIYDAVFVAFFHPIPKVFTVGNPLNLATRKIVST